jgi:hypothetical protein
VTAIDIATRDLEWEGCDNVRDLGGLVHAGGSTTTLGRLVRADNLDKLTDAGWQALWDYGVRTVIDLRNEEECRRKVARPDGLTMLRVPFDAYASEEWIAQWWPPGLPNNMARYLEDYPEAIKEFGAAIANAAPGGIVFNCKAGRDRTGMASMLLLRLAGVDRETVAADWEYSILRLRRYFTRTGSPDIKDDYLGDPDPELMREIREHVAAFLKDLEPEKYLGDEVRARLVGA